MVFPLLKGMVSQHKGLLSGNEYILPIIIRRNLLSGSSFFMEYCQQLWMNVNWAGISPDLNFYHENRQIKLKTLLLIRINLRMAYAFSTQSLMHWKRPFEHKNDLS